VIPLFYVGMWGLEFSSEGERRKKGEFLKNEKDSPNLSTLSGYSKLEASHSPPLERLKGFKPSVV